MNRVTTKYIITRMKALCLSLHSDCFLIFLHGLPQFLGDEEIKKLFHAYDNRLRKLNFRSFTKFRECNVFLRPAEESVVDLVN